MLSQRLFLDNDITAYMIDIHGVVDSNNDTRDSMHGDGKR